VSIVANPFGAKRYHYVSLLLQAVEQINDKGCPCFSRRRLPGKIPTIFVVGVPAKQVYVGASSQSRSTVRKTRHSYVMQDNVVMLR
jgi:hypothetical protein